MKNQLRAWLEDKRYDEIADLAREKNRVLGLLISLTYEPESLIAWRAIEALGAASARVAEKKPKVVRGILRRLHWLLGEDSGGICWFAPAAMAEIVARSPQSFQSYASIVVTLLSTMATEDLDHFRPNILWGIGRLGANNPRELEEVLPSIVRCLDNPDAPTRGMAVWGLTKIDRSDLLAKSEALLTDQASFQAFEDGELRQFTIAQATQEAILHHGRPARPSASRPASP